ncbi:MFS transporter [Streptomyces sp. FR-108]|uniref:MFS transporter n=1 Tax=Streptomyces sp. FR-108 TaxID=3416665 RepID=UPI003CE9758A
MKGGGPSSTHVFVLLWGGQLVSLLGSGSASFVLGLAAYSETRSTAALAAITAVTMVGTIYLAPLCGALADQFARRTVLLACNTAAGAVSLALAAVTNGGFGARFGWILLLVLTAALLNATLSVTLSVSVRRLRKEADLTRVNGITSFVESIPTLAGPVLGAALFSLVNPALIFVLDGVTFLMCAATVLRVRWPEAHRPARRRLRPFAGAAEGVRHILRDPGFRRLQLVFTGVNFFNGLSMAAVTAFVVASSHSGTAPWNLAAVNIGAATGLLTGSAMVILLAGRVDRRYLIGGGVLVGALAGRLGLVATAFVPLWIAAATVRNCSAQLSNAPLTAVWQERVPENIQATVFGARRLLGQGLCPVAVLLGGVAGDRLLNPSSSAVTPLAGLGGTFQGPEAGSTVLLVVAGLCEAALGVVLLRSGRIDRIIRQPAKTVPPDLVAGRDPTPLPRHDPPG